MEYQVTKQHFGDRQYYEGDIRTVEHQPDADELIKMGLIKAQPPDIKAAPQPRNKMAKEPENKAE